MSKSPVLSWGCDLRKIRRQVNLWIEGGDYINHLLQLLGAGLSHSCWIYIIKGLKDWRWRCKGAGSPDSCLIFRECFRSRAKIERLEVEIQRDHSNIPFGYDGLPSWNFILGVFILCRFPPLPHHSINQFSYKFLGISMGICLFHLLSKVINKQAIFLFLSYNYQGMIFQMNAIEL